MGAFNFMGSVPKFFVPPNFVVPRKARFKHIIKKYCPPNNLFWLPNLKTWLWACFLWQQPTPGVGNLQHTCHTWHARQFL